MTKESIASAKHKDQEKSDIQHLDKHERQIKKAVQ